MNKKEQMNFNVNNFLLATTKILDAREIAQKKISENHSLRIAFISLKIAERFGYEPKMMFDLCAYSLFHNYINDENLELLFIKNSENKLSSIVEVVHNLEEKYDFGNDTIENRAKIIDEIDILAVEQNIKDLLLEIIKPLSFWLDCQNADAMKQYVYTVLYDFTQVLTFEEVLKITSMFGSLYEDVDKFLKKCEAVCDYFGFEHKDKYTFLIAASMLDFGKLIINESLLGKKGKLNFTEYEIIKSNIYYNKNALKAIYGFDDIAQWASKHQEKLDGSGYPFLLAANNLSLKDRLMAILHIYDALGKNKPYRKAFDEESIFDILEKKAKNNEIDKVLVGEIKTIFKI